MPDGLDMIRAYLAGAVALAFVGLAGALWWQTQALASSKADVASLSREVAAQVAIADQARVARAVSDAYRKRETIRAAELQRGLETLMTGDFTNADTFIDPRIADFLDCLRRAPSGDADGCSGGLDGLENTRPD